MQVYVWCIASGSSISVEWLHKPHTLMPLLLNSLYSLHHVYLHWLISSITIRETNLKTKEKKKPKTTATPLSAYYVPGNVLNTFWTAFHIMLTT